MKLLRFVALAGVIALVAFTNGAEVPIAGDVYYKEKFVKADSVQVYLMKDDVAIDSAYIEKAGSKFKFSVSPFESHQIKAIRTGYLEEIIQLSPQKQGQYHDYYQLTVGKDTTHYVASGELIDGRKRVGNAYLWAYNTMTHEITRGRSDDSAFFSMSLRKGYDYQLWAKKAGYLKKVAYVNYCANKPEKNSKYCLKGFRDVNYVRNGDLEEPSLFLTMSMEAIDFDKTYRIDNIYYDLDKWYIRPDAAKELNKIVKVMNDNPEISIELGSHTDCRARDEYNLELSQKRAQSAVDYLISKGIDSTRMTAKGYGETKLVNKCADGVQCSEYMHQQNRRTEFRVTEVGEWEPEL